MAKFCLYIDVDKILVGIVICFFSFIFVTELWPLIDVRISFSFIIFRKNGWNLTNFCVCIDIDKIMIRIGLSDFLQIKSRVMPNQCWGGADNSSWTCRYKIAKLIWPWSQRWNIHKISFMAGSTSFFHSLTEGVNILEQLLLMASRLKQR